MYYINLKPYMNHKMIMPKGYKIDPNHMIGIENWFFNMEDFKLGQVESNKNGVTALFEKNNRQNDSLICSQQKIKLKEVPCKKISVFGVGSFGMYNEHLELDFKKGKKDRAYLSFADLCCSYSGISAFEYEEDFYRKNSCVFKEYDIDNRAAGFRKAYMYYNTTTFSSKRILKSIKMPNNCFISIFAITVDDEE